jgi:hypothetical protein
MANLTKLKKIQSLLNELISTMDETEPKEPKAAKSKEPKEPKEPKAPKETKEKPAKDPKNLPRMTGTISKQLQEVVEEVTTWQDSFKKEFADQVNSLSKEEYAAKDLKEHYEDFALSKNPPPAASQGGGGAEPAPPKEKVTTLTYKELKELKGLKETDDPLVFRAKKGLVTGPAEISEEEMDEGTFEGIDVLIGVDTRRVYNSEEEFMGWWGVGKFKEADM